VTRRFLLLGTVLLLGAGAAQAGPGAALPDNAALFAKLQQTAGSVQTLASDFVQEKYLGMFKTVLSSKGRFYFRRPDALRWELTAPVASGFVLQGERGRRWHERTGRMESFAISQEPIMKLVSDQLFAWARADFAWLEQEYRISVLSVLSEAPVALRLEPRSAAVAGFLHHLLITFSADGRYVRSVELHELDGDYTRINFINTAVNKPLSAELF
jgi:outer membrane lipoprotein-sorting protein